MGDREPVHMISGLNVVRAIAVVVASSVLVWNELPERVTRASLLILASRRTQRQQIQLESRDVAIAENEGRLRAGPDPSLSS